jgi:GH15 family glucan-1,4-alpha-glucosidase
VSLRLEDYAVVGDRRSAAVIGRDGSVDWLCLPRFDSGSCFSALLGGDARWSVAPAGRAVPVGRRYRPGSMVLETDLACEAGTMRITDCMPLAEGPQLVREVSAVEGAVEVCSDLRLSFANGTRPPLWRRSPHGWEAVAGPASVVLDGDVDFDLVDGAAVARFRVRPGRPVRLRLAWQGWGAAPRSDRKAVERTTELWQSWIAASTYRGDHRQAVERSLLVLQALSHRDTGGIVAAVTTSLPEELGGSRNWDYRYCWLRDATFTLLALLESGFRDEALAWREWLLRAAAGDPERLQIMYGIGGEAELHEREIDLPGYAGSRPVRVGNAASEQRQLDVYGEVLDALHQSRAQQLAADEDVWQLQQELLEVLESRWEEPDSGIWEMRGEPKHFVHSKVMAWVAADRAVQAVQRSGLPGPVDRWSALRDQIHEEVCQRGFDHRRGTFVQSYGSRALDAAVLLIPAVGFLSPRHPWVLSTLEVVQRELSQDGLLRRYDLADDALPGVEGCFLPCSFWLADALALAGRRRQARDVYERLLGLRNDVGLLSEEYDVAAGRALGNLPQALTMVPVVNTAHLLAGGGAARTRSRR